MISAMELLKSKRIQLLFTVLGLIGGLAYWKFIGCNSGTCPLTSNWHTSAIFGAFAGYFLGDGIHDKKVKKNGEV